MKKYVIFMLSLLLSFNAIAEDNNAQEEKSLDYSIEQDSSDIEEYTEYSEQYEEKSTNNDYDVDETYDTDDELEDY